MPKREFKRVIAGEISPPWKALAKQICLLFAAVLICLWQSLPVQAGADQSGKCSVDVELGTLSDIVITKVDSDGYFGSIHYETKDKVADTLALEQGSGGKMLPMKIRANNNTVRLTDLRGARLNSMQVTRKDCKFSHPVLGNRPLSQQWIVRAKLSH